MLQIMVSAEIKNKICHNNQNVAVNFIFTKNIIDLKIITGNVCEL